MALEVPKEQNEGPTFGIDVKGEEFYALTLMVHAVIGTKGAMTN